MAMGPLLHMTVLNKRRMKDIEFRMGLLNDERINLAMKSDKVSEKYQDALNKQTARFNDFGPQYNGGQAYINLNLNVLREHKYSIRKVDGSPVILQKEQRYSDVSEVPKELLNKIGITSGSRRFRPQDFRIDATSEYFDRYGLQVAQTPGQGLSVTYQGARIQQLGPFSELLSGANTSQSGDSTDESTETIPKAIRSHGGGGSGKPGYETGEEDNSHEQHVNGVGAAQPTEHNLENYIGGENSPETVEENPPETVEENFEYFDSNGQGLSAEEVLLQVNNYSQEIVYDEDLVKAFEKNPDLLIQGLINGDYILEHLDEEENKIKQISVSSNSSFLVEHDSSGDVVAEAEYDSEIRKIDQKDNELELELQKLNTEHSALETQEEQNKKLIENDINISFKTFG